MSNVVAQREEIRDSIREFLLKEFLPGEDPSALTDSTPLITGGILDSIDTVKLITFLEGQYGIQFEAHEVIVDYLDTTDRIVESVWRKLQ